QETKEALPFDLAVSADGEIIGIIWKDWRSEKGEIYFSCSLDGGKSWFKNARVNNESTLPMKVASLVINDDSSVYVLWTNLGPHKSILGGFKGEVSLYFSFGNIGN
ncbi:MAG: hypothetical protein QMC77_08990, partial [Methanocellales archaeon]|nr:hypothetical protein [Methanocellales archaeon]